MSNYCRINSTDHHGMAATELKVPCQRIVIQSDSRLDWSQHPANYTLLPYFIHFMAQLGTWGQEDFVINILRLWFCFVSYCGDVVTSNMDT